MKKVGIVTFHRSHNCGSILQAYALQTLIREKLGLENEIIDFSNEGQRKYYATLIWPKRFKDILRDGLYGLFIYPIEKYRHEYNRFIKEHLVLSPEQFKNNSEISRTVDRYSALVCGSDQVWNTRCVDADDAYFLSFASKKDVKKIAYATSMGANNINEMGAEVVDHYARLINDLDFVSVRERNAQKWISKLYNGEVLIEADPTLLVEKDVWNNIINPEKVEGDYIFYYSFGYDKKVCDVVKALSKKTDIPVYVMDAKNWAKQKLFTYGFKLYKHGNPGAFLSLIKNANIVITTSLHGTIFSTIFEKTFWYIKRNADNEVDDRAGFLLEQLALADRFILGKDLLEADPYKAPDYSACRNNVKNMREKGIRFLKKTLGDGE